MRYSDTYVEWLVRGPFEGRVDPFAEAAHYFHQIHGCFISELLERLGIPLLKMGYIASRETSLQVLERSQPDMAVRRDRPEGSARWNYTAAAEAVQMEAGIRIDENMPELESVYIRRTDESGDLISIIEVVSPGNKDKLVDIADYQDRRERFVREKGVNVVELDLTRSVKRLVRDRTASLYPYHIAIHLPAESRLIPLKFGESLHDFALPLHHEIIGVETQKAYDAAFRQASAAPQIERQGDYVLAQLPFPSLLNEEEKLQALKLVEQWHEKLNELKSQEG